MNNELINLANQHLTYSIDWWFMIFNQKLRIYSFNLFVYLFLIKNKVKKILGKDLNNVYYNELYGLLHRRKIIILYLYQWFLIFYRYEWFSLYASIVIKDLIFSFVYEGFYSVEFWKFLFIHYYMNYHFLSCMLIFYHYEGLLFCSLWWRFYFVYESNSLRFQWDKKFSFL